MGIEDLEGLSPKENKYAKLRRLLIQPEREEIDEIRRRMADQKQRIEDVASALPEAVRVSTGSGDELGRALSPTLEGAIRTSIRKDTRSFADLLFPIMGPAIRKAIAQTLKDLIQNMNQALEHSFSLRGLKWRLEAMRTGKSFGDVVLHHTLVYRVEQLFLIHRETGLVLKHLVVPEVEAQDAGMVSGMLTAIQDFVKDSFNVGGEETLETMEVGGLNVWVDQGPKAVLAAAIRGQAPQSLRRLLRETLEEIHMKFGEELEEFEGDSAPFDLAEATLEPCLQVQTEAAKKRISPLLWIIPLILLGLLAWWLFSQWGEVKRVRAMADLLNGEPGIELLEAERHGGLVHLRGFRDTLSREPDSLLRSRGFDTEDVQYRWKEFLSLEGPIVLARARQILDPPPVVHLEYADGVLSATGAAEADWILWARDRAPLIPGVERFDDSAIQTGNLALFDAASGEIEKSRLQFSGTTAELAPGQGKALDDLALTVRHLFRTAEALGKDVRLAIVGHTDPSGTPEINEILSLARAQSVWDALAERGVPVEWMSQVGMGPGQPMEGVDPEEQPQALRRVTFHVIEGDTLEGNG